MQQPPVNKNMDCTQFPRQKVLCDSKPFSRELLHGLLETVYSASPPFTGYFKFSGDECSLLFLFFFNGTPYAAGRYADSKPFSYSIHDLGRQLLKFSSGALSVTLCKTDPVLLKSMLLFLQEEPAVKAPPSLLDFEHIVQQIGEVGAHALIALCRDQKINFFFFRDGKGALAYYADLVFERPEGMTIDEEMLLYAFQPGDKVQAYVFRDMITTMSEDSSLLDKDSLYKLLTEGYLKDRRSGSRDLSPMAETAVAEERIKKKPRLPSVALSVESGPNQGDNFTVTLPCSIGRKDCDLILNDRLISRRHAELKIVDNKLVIEDLVSTNGTMVNGKKVTRKQLAPNDLIAIGPTSLRVSRAK